MESFFPINKLFVVEIPVLLATVYEYDDVPHQTYTQFRMTDSQGKFFSSKIAKAFKYKKL